MKPSKSPWPPSQFHFKRTDVEKGKVRHLGERNKTKIAQIEKIPVAYHVRKEGWPVKEYPAVILKLSTSNGLVGLGEAVAWPRYYGNTLEHNYKLLEIFEENLKGEDPRNLNRIFRIVESLVGNNAPGAWPSKDGLFMALFDVIGKNNGQPVYEILGGSYRTEFDTMVALYNSTPESMAQAAKECVSRGIKGLKVKCGLELGRTGWNVETFEREVNKVVKALEAVPRSVLIDADSNQAWGTASRTISAVKRYGLEQYDNLGIEQPVRYFDLEGAARIRQAVSVSVVLDETIVSPTMLIEVIRRNAADRIVLKPSRVGGLSVARDMIAIAEAAGIGVILDTAVYSTIGDTSLCHLAAVIKDSYPLPVGDNWFKENPVKRGGFVVENGKARVSSVPGLGIEIDEDLIESIRVKVSR